MIFIINPISGTVKGKHFENEIHQVFPKENYDVQICFTEYRGHASEIAEELSREECVIVAVGGDGTINEVGKKLLYSKTASLGIIPMGSGNGLARSLSIPLELREALRHIKKGEPVSVDTCSFNGIPFFCTAGIAFDALVAKDFDELPQRGLKTYFQASFRQFRAYKPLHITAEINGEVVSRELFMLAIANAKQYGYGVKISPLSSLTDGKLEIVLVEKMNYAEFAEFTLRLFLGTVQNFKYSKVIQTDKEVRLLSKSKWAHLDGEPLEFGGEAVIRIHPSSLRIIL